MATHPSEHRFSFRVAFEPFFISLFETVNSANFDQLFFTLSNENPKTDEHLIYSKYLALF